MSGITRKPWPFSSLQSVYRHNFRAPIKEVDNIQSAYALEGEDGLLLCSWPNGDRPRMPFFYCDEVWTGVEYQVAAHLICEGFVAEGLRIVRAVRARYDGLRRNPWNEVECGHHYARSLASWSLIPALSGVRYSAVEQSLTFAPRLPLPFRCVVAAGTAWGLLEVEDESATLDIRHGFLTLTRFGYASDPLRLDPARELIAGTRLRISLPATHRPRS